MKTLSDYNAKYHVIGRIWTALAIALFVMIPVSIGLYYKQTPDWKVFGSAAVIIPLIINFLSGIVEPIIYAPMLGTNSEYLAFITGNLSNLKIPCVVKAQEICGTKLGTEENEVVSTLAVAVSTLVTVVIVAIFVLCLGLSNLGDVVKKNEWIMPAFTCVVYALFGSLGGKYVTKNPKLAIFPAIIIVVLSVILGVVKVGGSIGSAYLFVGIGICAIFATLQVVRDKKKRAAAARAEELGSISDSHVQTDMSSVEYAAADVEGNEADEAEQVSDVEQAEKAEEEHMSEAASDENVRSESSCEASDLAGDKTEHTDDENGNILSDGEGAEE